MIIIRLVLLLSFLSSSAIAADQIEFPEEELATESVLPVFDKTVVVRNRTVTNTGRIEFGGGIGLSLIEAIYNNLSYGINGTYHLDETNALNLSATFMQEGLSSNGEDLKNGVGILNEFDASLAPSPEYYIFGNYQVTAYYGKISVTKSRAMNLSLYGILGGGVVSFGDTVEPAVNFGFGQKLYFSPDFALKVDLSVAAYNGPDPTSPKDGSNLTPGSGSRDSDDFDSIFYVRSFLSAGLVFLL